MTPWLDDGDVRLYHGDALQVLRGMPDGSVDCVVTSPPYWGLRDYGTEGQIGLEETPDLFVQGMVAVFREVRRVLADHGTCWVNLGDSYASSPPGNNPETLHRSSGLHGVESQKYRDTLTAGTNTKRNTVVGGLKPKDLVGIPWMVARALQGPYYTGDIRSERDRVWLAATIDAEGTICGFRHDRKDDGRVRTGVHVHITNTSRRMLDEAQRIWPTSREDHNAHGEGHYGSLPIWRWIAHGAEKKAQLLRELYPHLLVKRTQALLAYNLLLFQMDGKRLGRSAHGDELRAKRELLTRLLSDANAQRDVDVPSWCREPETMFEPGWYLRSDIVWTKPNPMPESVTDRPTKSHEYVFLLTKQPRYWFDAEAVREPHSPDGRIKTVHDHKTDRSHPNYDNVGNGNERWPNGGRNVRSVWNIATQPYPEAHFATFPEELARRCILAGCPVRVCRVCGKPSERIVERETTQAQENWSGSDRGNGVVKGGGHEGRTGQWTTIAETVGWSDCGHNTWRPGHVLDPFIGSGTVAKVARDHQRHAIGIDLNQQYLQLAARRLQQLSLLADPA